MANYAVTTTTYGPSDLATLLSAMETYIETVDDAKTIYNYDWERQGSRFVGVIVHKT